MQTDFLAQFMQAFIDVFQGLFHPFQYLLLGRVDSTVKDWKDVILLHLVGVVLVDNLLCLFRQTAIHHLACLASCIVDASVVNISISQ